MSTADCGSTRFKEGEGGQVFWSLAESVVVVVEVEMIETGSSHWGISGISVEVQ